jgi:hypothetical protein
VSECAIYWDQGDERKVTSLRIQHKKCHADGWWIAPSAEAPKGRRTSNMSHDLQAFANADHGLWMLADLCVSDDWDEAQLKRLVKIAQAVSALATADDKKAGAKYLEFLHGIAP